MPPWSPQPEWNGQDAYIVGGGRSLEHFDWELLRGKHTIGCNSAFILGASIIQITIFADILWWDKIGKKGTETYGGRVVACSPRAIEDLRPWLLTMDRYNGQGLGTRDLGYNGNTGSLALNLALILGARRVYLLGFDMFMRDAKPNWHDVRYEKGVHSVYPGFVREFAHVARDLQVKFPGREVWNVTDESNLPYFPRVTPAEHFGCPVTKKEATC